MSDFHVVAANLIEKHGTYLLVQEGKEAVRGQWNLPAGGVEPDEDIMDAARREASEETGMDVEVRDLVGVFVDESDRSDATVLVFVFHSVSDETPETPSDEEILDVDFFQKEEFREIDIRVPFLEEAVARFEKGELKELETLKDYRRE